MKYILISLAIVILGFFGVFNPVKEIVLGVIAPVQFGMRKIAVNHKDMLNFLASANKVREENLTLLQKVDSLEEEVSAGKLLTTENELLRNQLKVSIDHPNASVVATGLVMGNPLDSTGGTLLVNRGSRDGVRVNDSVVIGNNIVGVIRDCSYSRSVVELITSPTVSLTAYDLNTPNKTQGLVTGSYGSSITLERILPNEKVSVGDLVVTSGRDGMFCPGYVVGKITGIDADPSRSLVTAKLMPVLDFSNITQVFIVRAE